MEDLDLHHQVVKKMEQYECALCASRSWIVSESSVVAAQQEFPSLYNERKGLQSLGCNLRIGVWKEMLFSWQMIIPLSKGKRRVLSDLKATRGILEIA